ncbi:MAG TPA: phosphoglucosamine mutase [bacterium]|nr:phosphoglucosamine mutase [bacterium]
MGRLFGTDGIRGIANADLSTELVDRVGRAAVHVLASGGRGRFAVGRDPRISGHLLEAALAAGMASAGADVLRLGVIPTPAVAYLARLLGVHAGIVISASHNPVEDNGVKFFAATGFKLPDAVEAEIEGALDRAAALPRPIGSRVGRMVDVPDAAERYLAYVAGLARTTLEGWRIVVDCANGATSALAPALWERLGATVIPIHAAPDGTNINAGCGSTHPEVIQSAAQAQGADVGFAHDGDGDRAIAADRYGHLIDGDAIMGITALHRQARAELPGDLVVATVMSNLGLEQALRGAGIRLERVRVGDRYVLERMLETGARVGGEQSGHVIFLDRATTGDGLITAVELVNVMLDSGRRLEELRAPFARYPQVLLNVRVVHPERWADDPEILRAIARAEARLGGRGRILIRASGTEPLVRVMTESEDAGIAEEIARELTELVTRQLGGAAEPAAPDGDSAGGMGGGVLY